MREEYLEQSESKGESALMISEIARERERERQREREREKKKKEEMAPVRLNPGFSFWKTHCVPATFQNP